jgi:hypothetical protein
MTAPWGCVPRRVDPRTHAAEKLGVRGSNPCGSFKNHADYWSLAGRIQEILDATPEETLLSVPVIEKSDFTLKRLASIGKVLRYARRIRATCMRRVRYFHPENWMRF